MCSLYYISFPSLNFLFYCHHVLKTRFNETFFLVPGTSSASNNGNGMFFMMFLWVVVLLVLFVYRPASMRRPIGPFKNNRVSVLNIILKMFALWKKCHATVFAF